MIKKLVKHGNSMALVIEKPVLELLKIDPDTALEISTNGEMLVIVPVRDEKHAKKFDRAVEKVSKKYSKVLKRLAG